MTKQQTKSKQRVADHGEVFTAKREVKAMLDLVKQETENIESRFLEPACGDGNFLVEILRRKLAVVKFRYEKNPNDYERYAVIAVTSIYGIDILPDNVKRCRKRVYKIFNREYTANCKEKVNDETRKAVRYILRHNIICGNTLRMKKRNGKPIEFIEWSEAEKKKGYLKRRYFQRYILRHNIICGNTLRMKKRNGKPIEFIEWSEAKMKKGYLKRRYFQLTHLIEANTKIIHEGYGEGLFGDDDSDAQESKPESPPIHYRKLGNDE